MQLIEEIDRIVEHLTPYQRWWIGIQIHRAALSIASNIAEGHDHDYRTVYLRHLADAKGSTREVETQLLVISRQKNVVATETEVALGLVDEIGRMLRSLTWKVRASRLEKDSAPLAPST